MSGLIRISGSVNCNTSNTNTPPTIKKFSCIDKTNDTITIKYIAEDAQGAILRHYIYVNGLKKEITDEVKWNKPNNEFEYTIIDLKKDTQYNVQIEVSDSLDITQSEILHIQTTRFLIYGVEVDETNSNPETSVKYINDAVGIKTATSTSLGGWEDKFPFDRIRIVGFKNGQVVKEIKKEDKTKYIDETNVGNDVDVMIEIPKFYWDFEDTEKGYKLNISNKKFNSTCDCYAHKVGGIEKDYIYVGAYLGFVDSDKLRSNSCFGHNTYGISIRNARTYAQANGGGYQQLTWYTVKLLQILYLIAYKNLDCQTALGMGFIEMDRNNTIGGTDNKGMVYGESTGTQQMCFLGIEDLWCSKEQHIDGMFIDRNFNLKTTNDNKTFNDDATNFKTIGKLDRNFGNFTSKVIHTNEGCFFPLETNGSNTTYYCDQASYTSNCFGSFYGDGYDKYGIGIFGIIVYNVPDRESRELVARLTFLG